jgi:hypothetical protein
MVADGLTPEQFHEWSSLLLAAGGLQPMFHLFVSDQASLLKDRLSARKDDEVGDSADLETSGELRVCFRINL